jgi:hypothetical protein
MLYNALFASKSMQHWPWHDSLMQGMSVLWLARAQLRFKQQQAIPKKYKKKNFQSVLTLGGSASCFHLRLKASLSW